MRRFAVKPSASRSRSGLLDARAQGLRSALTMSEAKLWAELSGKKLGVSFRRQVPVVHRFIVDSLAPALKLVVEVDGSAHAYRHRGRADAGRDAMLRKLGYRVVRVEADEVMNDMAQVVERIHARSLMRGRLIVVLDAMAPGLSF